MNFLFAITLFLFPNLHPIYSIPKPNQDLPRDIKLKIENNYLESWEPKTQEQVNEIYEKCAISTKTEDKVLQLFKSHILSSDAADLIFCVDLELGILKDGVYFADRVIRQSLTSLGHVEHIHLTKCLTEANQLSDRSLILVYLHECIISHTLWKRPGGELARENKQTCQTIHNITQYDICHEKDVLKIVRYSICDNMKSGVFEGNDSVGYGYNFHRMALHTFAYLPPFEVYLDIGKCMEQGRAYKAEELMTVMDCINRIIPPKWKPKTNEEIRTALSDCRKSTNISDEFYNLLKQRTVKHDSIDFLRCVSWQLGMETGGCYVSHRTVAQIKLMSPDIEENYIEKMVEVCYSENLTTKENWNEFKYHQCIMTMKGLGEGSKYLEAFM